MESNHLKALDVIIAAMASPDPLCEMLLEILEEQIYLIWLEDARKETSPMKFPSRPNPMLRESI